MTHTIQSTWYTAISKIANIGQTGRILTNRILEHRGYISKDDTSKATGDHFNLPGHSLSDFTVTILEQV